MKDKEIKEKETQENYMVLGMCFGLLAGSAGMSILSMFGKSSLGGVCVGVGLLLGLVIGMMIPKNN